MPSVTEEFQKTTPAHRVLWIDRAKALGIVLVVLGHEVALPRELTDFIYRFHMPMFFMLSGAVCSPKRLLEGFRPWIARQARALLLPYLFFWLISAAWWLIIRNIGQKALESAGIPLWAPVTGLLWGTGETLFVNPPLWFFPATFVTALSFWGIWKLTKGKPKSLVLAFLALWALGCILPTSANWARLWNLDLLPWTIASYLAGFVIQHTLRQPSSALNHLAKYRFPLLLLALAVIATSAFLPVWDWNGRQFGPIPGLSLIASVVTAAAVCYLLGRIPGSWSAPLLAHNTLFIFPLHGLVFSVLTGLISKGLGVQDWPEKGAWPAVFLYTLAGILGSLIGGAVLKRLFPKIFTSR